MLHLNGEVSTHDQTVSSFIDLDNGEGKAWVND